MKCKNCLKEKDKSDFYPHRKMCKSCIIQRSILWRKNNKERFKIIKKKYEKKRRLTPAYKKYQKKYYSEWYKRNGRNRDIDYIEAIIEWQKNHPEAVKAQKKLHYALKTGKIVKPELCEKCKEKKRLSAHHEDYSKPLDVKWLCSSCHKIEHNNNKILNK
jgi:hypothetical protein